MKKYISFIILVLLIFPYMNSFGEEEPESKTVKEWKAIIAYFPGNPEEVTEDWIFFLFDIEEHYSADEKIYVIGIFSGDKTIVPIGPGDKRIAQIDISEFTGSVAGYIFVMNGKAPLWSDYLPSSMVLEKADLYFYGEQKKEDL